MKNLLALLLALAAGAAAAQPAHPVILVSMDGFRPDYLERGVTPNLNRLAAGGARAVAMRPSFPSVTFPNHYTLVTGMRPDHHGIVDNVMNDAAISDKRFTMSNSEAVVDRRWWDQAEPVWVTAERNGVRSGTMFWPGSEAAIHGVRPTLAPKFDGKLPATARVDTLLSWLDRPAGERFGFMTLYFDDVDHAGHEFGPAAAQTTEAVALVDQAIGRLLAGLAARHIEADIVIVSDHGMAPVSAERVIRMQTLLPEGSYEDVASGSYATINPAPGRGEQLAAALLIPQEHMQCWRKEEIPARLAYGHNARVPAFLCLAEPGWSIVFNDKSAAKVKGGKHGYDNAAPEMEATFIAAGPSFKPGVVLPEFDNVDVYPLVMHLLDVAPLPSDGDLTPLLPALVQ
ncbi:alkaline phosphatase family protein [Pseudoduganella sp. FT25W]|uniref:Alkaline phosphatase family protein n=1 Tax=Duganella alba TaxID=2666081 RepID=A0A6L5QFP8_9BURK|nr:ectonucleotide pyrophosphatase/phosphodiesterase [Duganella alba]MRX08525.1 alkaline phosphatase family protein [Duganella alba]MRX17001.1 alkaline phosphatase family protein [Duganella alba]